MKIWDKNKTLLREIIMNETLTVASFLNTQGTDRWIFIDYFHERVKISLRLFGKKIRQLSTLMSVMKL